MNHQKWGGDTHTYVHFLRDSAKKMELKGNPTLNGNVGPVWCKLASRCKDDHLVTAPPQSAGATRPGSADLLWKVCGCSQGFGTLPSSPGPPTAVAQTQDPLASFWVGALGLTGEGAIHKCRRGTGLGVQSLWHLSTFLPPIANQLGGMAQGRTTRIPRITAFQVM